ncbi:MAG: M23 family metallopeptidase [Acidobacteria bacterium]|nr:MAG: M23 family metallopeptidase [Acidobacteriota bacterium]
MVRHDWDGQVDRVPIPVRWVVAFVICAAVGLVTIAGFAGSYGRMLIKVQAFNELRSRQNLLESQLDHTRKDADTYKAEVASLGSLASEVSALYNFKHNASLKDRVRNASRTPGLPLAASANLVPASQIYADTLSSFQVLETRAMAASLPLHNRMGAWEPDIWPVRGRITSSFGERIDPFQGEGAFHAGIDIAVPFGTSVHVTADGVVVFAGIMDGYGRTVIVDHGHGVQTLYAHMSSLAVAVGQQVDRDEVVGYVGESGWTTGPHLHYEVRIHHAPVNPYSYLR